MVLRGNLLRSDWWEDLGWLQPPAQMPGLATVMIVHSVSGKLTSLSIGHFQPFLGSHGLDPRAPSGLHLHRPPILPSHAYSNLPDLSGAVSMSSMDTAFMKSGNHPAPSRLLEGTYVHRKDSCFPVESKAARSKPLPAHHANDLSNGERKKVKCDMCHKVAAFLCSSCKRAAYCGRFCQVSFGGLKSRPHLYNYIMFSQLNFPYHKPSSVWVWSIQSSLN